MSKALLPQELLAMGCELCPDDPDHEHDSKEEPIILHSRCHPAKPTWVAVNKKDKTLDVTCAQCGRMVTRIDIATPGVVAGSN